MAAKPTDFDDADNIRTFLDQIGILETMRGKYGATRHAKAKPQPATQPAPASTSPDLDRVARQDSDPPPEMSMGTILPPRGEAGPTRGEEKQSWGPPDVNWGDGGWEGGDPRGAKTPAHGETRQKSNSPGESWGGRKWDSGEQHGSKASSRGEVRQEPQSADEALWDQPKRSSGNSKASITPDGWDEPVRGGGKPQASNAPDSLARSKWDSGEPVAPDTRLESSVKPYADGKKEVKKLHEKHTHTGEHVATPHPQPQRSGASTRAESGDGPLSAGATAPPSTPLSPGPTVDSEAVDEDGLVGFHISAHLEKLPPRSLADSTHAPRQGSGLRGTSNTTRAEVKKFSPPAAPKAPKLAYPSDDLLTDFATLMANMKSFLDKYQPAPSPEPSPEPAPTVVEEDLPKEPPAADVQKANLIPCNSIDAPDNALWETQDGQQFRFGSGTKVEEAEPKQAKHSTPQGKAESQDALATNQSKDNSSPPRPDKDEGPASQSSLSVEVDETDRDRPLPATEASSPNPKPIRATSPRHEPILNANEAVMNEREPSLASRRKLQHRSGPTAVPRSVLISRLPTGATAQFVASIIFGGPVERIQMEGDGKAKVTFLRAKDRGVYLEATGDRMPWSTERKDQYVEVSAIDDSNTVDRALQDMLDDGATRCVFAIGDQTVKTLEDLKELREVRDLQFECAEEKQERGGSQFNFRMCNIQDAVKLKLALARDREWAQLDVLHYQDPCGLEWGTAQRKLHFASGTSFSPCDVAEEISW